MRDDECSSCRRGISLARLLFGPDRVRHELASKRAFKVGLPSPTALLPEPLLDA